MYLLPLTPLQRDRLTQLLRDEDSATVLGKIAATLESLEEYAPLDARERLRQQGLEARLDWEFVHELMRRWGPGWTEADVLAVVMHASSRSLWQPR